MGCIGRSAQRRLGRRKRRLVEPGGSNGRLEPGMERQKTGPVHGAPQLFLPGVSDSPRKIGGPGVSTGVFLDTFCTGKKYPRGPGLGGPGRTGEQANPVLSGGRRLPCQPSGTPRDL